MSTNPAPAAAVAVATRTDIRMPTEPTELMERMLLIMTPMAWVLAFIGRGIIPAGAIGKRDLYVAVDRAGEPRRRLARPFRIQPSSQPG